MSNYSPIDYSNIQKISDQKSFIKFLTESLYWPIKDDVEFEKLIFYWDTNEFGYEKEYFRDSTIFQIRPFNKNQPWGIFILHLKTPRIYISELKNILRSLAPSKRKLKDYPTWQPNHLLFICTHDWKNYTFAHFDGDKPQTAKLSTFSWEYNSSYLRTVCEYNLSAIKMPEDLDLFGDFDAARWVNQWQEAFNIKKVTDKFFEEMFDVFEEIQAKYIHGIRGEPKRSFAHLLINRLLFLKFLEKKGWLFADKDDNEFERRNYLNKQFIKHKNLNLWDQFFYHLFFKGLNRKYSGGISEYPVSVKSLIGFVPFLNGGLFEEAFEAANGWNDKGVKVDNKAFELIFDTLLNPYNFTIAENTPLDIEVALNPDLLGYAYEELIAKRHDQGAFYTHPTEVGLMCHESLKAYLEEHTKISPITIAKLVDLYNPEELSDVEAFEIYKILIKIKILDPAVGSGAYPVRMMQELVAIHQALAEKLTSGQLGYITQNKLVSPHNRYELKLGIIENNLYGADIDYFSVEIAKLRFWLSLVVDYSEEVKQVNDLDKLPALPNLDFKLRTGDSLLSILGKSDKTKSASQLNLDLVLMEKSGKGKSAKRNVGISSMGMFFEEEANKLRALKKTYFNFEELKKEKKLPPHKVKEEYRQEIIKQEENLAKLIGVTDYKKFDRDHHILWQIHFAEVFDSEGSFGFDICIANPPYLRQEKINELFSKFESGITKDDLVETYETLYSDIDLDIDKKSDLYVYFFLRGLQLLREKGILCFICSNSWLDVGFGTELQEVLLRKTRIRAIYDNSAKRSFEKADVNTTINIFIKDATAILDGIAGQKKVLKRDNIVRFVTFKDEFERTATSEEIYKISQLNKITSTDNWRVYPIKQNDLYDSGVGDEFEYDGDKWGGKYLRAPDIFFTIIEKGGKKLIPLIKIAKFNFGIKSGVNEFYYFDKIRAEEWEIEKNYLKSIIKSPRESKFVRIQYNLLPNKIIICKKQKTALKNTKLLQYINWGEKQKTEDGIYWKDVPSVQGRELWYSIEENYSDDFIIPRTFNDIYICHLGGVNYSDRFYGIISSEKRLITFFNSTLFILFSESLAKQGLGLGALDLNIREFIKIPVLIDFPKAIIIEREMKSVFEECGFDKAKPIRSQKPKPLPDRKALDDIIFDALGLTQAERNEVYYAVCELVQNRLNKARSV